MTRAYFLGAGASKQDQFPLTSELKHGVAWAICHDRERFRDLAAHLRHLYNVDDARLLENAKAWEALRSRSPLHTPAEPDDTAPGSQHDVAAPVDLLPDVTDWLSTLDWMIREQSSFGPHRDTSGPSKLSLLQQLTQVRDLVVQALCVSLGLYERDLPSGSAATPTTKLFMDRVQPDDLLVTTNWICCSMRPAMSDSARVRETTAPAAPTSSSRTFARIPSRRARACSSCTAR